MRSLLPKMTFSPLMPGLFRSMEAFGPVVLWFISFPFDARETYTLVSLLGTGKSTTPAIEHMRYIRTMK